MGALMQGPPRDRVAGKDSGKELQDGPTINHMEWESPITGHSGLGTPDHEERPVRRGQRVAWILHGLGSGGS